MQKNKLKHISLLTTVLIFGALLLNSREAYAAQLFFESTNNEFVPGGEFLIDVFLNTESETINAVGGKLTFPPQLLEMKEIRDGNSIVNLWVDKPAMENLGIISFSGITPGGYNNDRIFILSVVFMAKEIGSGTIGISEEKVLKNDGMGTPASAQISPFQFFIIKESATVEPGAKFQVKPIEGTDPPEEFKPAIARDETVFDGKYFLVFATQDKGSGIDHYEVSEHGLSPFHIVESPYLLQNQKLDREISVKAVDKSGNIRIEIIYPSDMYPWYENFWMIIVLIIGAITIMYMMRKKPHA